MKTYLLLPVLAAITAMPALAQTTQSPSDLPVGSDAAREKSVIDGAVQSTDPRYRAPEGTIESPSKGAAGQGAANDAQSRKDTLEGAIQSGESTGRSSTKEEIKTQSPSDLPVGSDAAREKNVLDGVK